MVRGYADDDMHYVSVELVDVGLAVQVSKFQVQQLPIEYLSVIFFYFFFSEIFILKILPLGGETFDQIAAD